MQKNCLNARLHCSFWNVNGLARKLCDTDFIEIVQSHDIIILTETWISKNSNINLDIKGYCCDHLFGNKSKHTKKGRFSGGISIYFRQTLKDKIQVIEKNQSGILWFKICNSMFNFESDLYICSVYIPPKNSKVTTSLDPDVDLFETIETDIEKYQQCGKILVTGDFNARTSNINDFTIYDTYLDQNVHVDMNENTIPRANMDHVIDAYGQRLIRLCKSTDLLIANGRLLNDAGIGDFTFYNEKGCSVVDYLLLNQYDFNLIESFDILMPNEFSDHCSISFSIKRKAVRCKSRDPEPECQRFIVWDDTRVNDLLTSYMVNVRSWNEYTII